MSAAHAGCRGTDPDDAEGEAMSVPALPGRLRPERLVGSGAYATVWLARDPDLDCDVAVKILAENWAYRADVRERFLSEARLMRRVDHEGIVRVYDVGALADGRPFLVMTYAAGGSLHDRLDDGPLDPDLARAVLHRVGAALIELHRHGIVHRDVNPRNILFTDDPRTEPNHAALDATHGDTRDGPARDPAAEFHQDPRSTRVMLADLGLAKDLAAESGLTQPVGTGAYRAPEQRAYSDRIGPATDVYALATVAGDVLPAAICRVAPVADALARGHAADPADRPDVAEILDAIDAAYAQVNPTEARQAPGPAAGADPRRRGIRGRGMRGRGLRRPWAALLLVGLLALVAVGGWLGWRQWLAPVRVADPTGTVSVAVPHDWVAEGTARLPGATEPGAATGSGLVVRSPEGTRRVEVTWATGAHDAADQFALEQRPGCRVGSPVPVTAAGLPGQRTSWTGCAGGRSYVVAVLTDGTRRTVEVRIDQSGDQPAAEEILAGLRVS